VETGAFVVNVPVEANLDALHLTSADHGPTESETDLHAIDLAPSVFVAPPRIISTPIQMECRLNQVVPLGRGLNSLYIGDVLAFHLDNAIFDGRHVDLLKLRPIMRLAGPHYATIGEVIHRPQMFVTPGTTKTQAAT
jgi:flavin reductase (DIM6/NTAB) family NADH-FMN oxidoreductase RutF